jgi:predicted GNAT family acetyltransferase
MIRALTETTVPRAQAFLETHAETSLFLLSNLATFGPRLGKSFNSGNFHLIEEDGEVIGVFCLTRCGNLLVQTGSRNDLASVILSACDKEPISIEGVIGDWQAADSIWKHLSSDYRFQPTYTSKERLYKLALPAASESVVSPRDMQVRRLNPQDFEQWEPLSTAYFTEVGLPAQGTVEQRKASFDGQAAAGHWWGTFAGGRLVSMTGLNAAHGALGQVGGTYTLSSERRKGLARTTMGALLTEASGRHHLQEIILFTGEGNLAARSLYESLGFTVIGNYGLFFGSWTED